MKLSGGGNLHLSGAKTGSENEVGTQESVKAKPANTVGAGLQGAMSCICGRLFADVTIIVLNMTCPFQRGRAR